MENIHSSDLKTILHSKRANIYYLEHCRVLVKDGRVEYVTEEGSKSLYWNIPIANTTTVLLGMGTSITQAAMRKLAKAGVLVGFCGGGGTPLFSANEFDIEVAWFSPQSEYRPTEYLQSWVRFWFDDVKRIQAAKELQILRIAFTQKQWIRNRQFHEAEFYISPPDIERICNKYLRELDSVTTIMPLFSLEAKMTKELYAIAARTVKYGEFTRSKRGESIDAANQFLDHGNYLAYGLGATATWVLGIPHGLSVMHGKTRRGGLVFDTADLVKDGLILPQAFISATRGDSEQQFRRACIQNLLQNEALDFMIDSLKEIAAKLGAVN
jgi:CRISPR-associated protein Cas1